VDDKAQKGLSITAAKMEEANKTQPSAAPKTTGRSKAIAPGEVANVAITCQRETLLIADYLSSQLSPHTLIAFESHLKTCPDCQSLLHTYKKTVELTRAFLELESANSRLPRLALRRRNSQGIGE
jgi:hypothetical protein